MRVAGLGVVGSNAVEGPGSVEPELLGPYATDEERLEAARDIDTDEHGIFRLDVTGTVEVGTFGARGDWRIGVLTKCMCGWSDRFRKHVR